MGVSHCNNDPLRIGDGCAAQALGIGEHGKLSMDAPVLVLLFLTKKLDTLVDFDVLLATYVRGLEFVVTHCFTGVSIELSSLRRIAASCSNR